MSVKFFYLFSCPLVKKWNTSSRWTSIVLKSCVGGSFSIDFHSNFLQRAIWVTLIYKVSSIVPLSFLEGLGVETSFESILFFPAVSPPHQPSNKFRNNNYPIHFYALIWRNRNERAINFIQLNCIICITNTLIEKNESDIWHDCLCWDFSSAHISTFA
jgi:hypothetical protein